MCWRRNRDQAVPICPRATLAVVSCLFVAALYQAPGMQVADIRAPARAFFLKSSIPYIHKKGRHGSYGTAIALTRPEPNKEHQSPEMRIEGEAIAAFLSMYLSFRNSVAGRYDNQSY